MKFQAPLITLATLAVALASYAVQVTVPRTTASVPQQPVAVCLGHLGHIGHLGHLQALFKEIGS